MDKTAITRLLRSWEAVANIVTRVVADQLDAGGLAEVYRIGVDCGFIDATALGPVRRR